MVPLYFCFTPLVLPFYCWMQAWCVTAPALSKHSQMNSTTANINTSWTKSPLGFGLLLVMYFMALSGWVGAMYVYVCLQTTVCEKRRPFLPALVPAPVVRSAPMRLPERWKREESKREKNPLEDRHPRNIHFASCLLPRMLTQFNHNPLCVCVCVSTSCVLILEVILLPTQTLTLGATGRCEWIH